VTLPIRQPQKVSLRFFFRWSRAAALLVVVLALDACAGDADSAAPSTPAPPGVARQRDTYAGWTVIGTGDFNLDGQVDVLWNEPTRNAIAVWLMQGTHLLAPGPVIPGPVGDGWVPLTPAELNFDGMNDVPWSNPKDGSMAVWLMGGTHLLAAGPVIPGPPGAGWSAVDAGDFNLDGAADVLWYNSAAHTMSVWLMNGTHLLVPGPALPTPAGAGWVVTTVTDFNLDGQLDVLWTNPVPITMAVWLMRGTHLLSAGPEIPGPSGPGWAAITAADFNFDGMNDVIWSNPAKGSMAVWLMSGSHLLAAGPEIPGPIGPGWTVAYAGDFNFDGMADAIWQNTTTHRMAIWLMAGTHLLAPGPEIPGPAPLGP
jgi:hypothetical protein